MSGQHRDHIVGRMASQILVDLGDQPAQGIAAIGLAQPAERARRSDDDDPDIGMLLGGAFEHFGRVAREGILGLLVPIGLAIAAACIPNTGKAAPGRVRSLFMG